MSFFEGARMNGLPVTVEVSTPEKIAFSALRKELGLLPSEVLLSSVPALDRPCELRRSFDGIRCGLCLGLGGGIETTDPATDRLFASAAE